MPPSYIAVDMCKGQTHEIRNIHLDGEKQNEEIYISVTIEIQDLAAIVFAYTIRDLQILIRQRKRLIFVGDFPTR